MSTAEEEASISIPSIAFVAILGFVIYKYFFAASSRTATPNSSSSSRATPRFTSQQVDQVAAMFPQLSRRDIMWDLHRNRGSVAATTERVLMGGRLEPAPPTFQPMLPTSPTGPTIPIITGASKITVEPDLITRYNLQAKVDASAKGKGKEEPDHGWAASQEERQAMLKRRRDEMILAARRKMMERDASGGGGGGGAVAGSQMGMGS